MSKEIENNESELDLLKERATQLGIPYSNNIGVDTLRQRINDKLASADVKPASDDKLPEYQRAAIKRGKLIAEARKLVRVSIKNLNPSKADLTGEIITVANDIVGTISRYVPYNLDDNQSWHIEKMLYDFLKEREFLQLQESRRRGSNDVPKQFWVKEFNIQVLPDLTPEELKELARQQAASGSSAE